MMKTFSFTMHGKVHAPTKAEAEELLHSVCDGVSVETTTIWTTGKKNDVPAKKSKATTKPVRKGA